MCSRAVREDFNGTYTETRRLILNLRPQCMSEHERTYSGISTFRDIWEAGRTLRRVVCWDTEYSYMHVQFQDILYYLCYMSRGLYNPCPHCTLPPSPPTDQQQQQQRCLSSSNNTVGFDHVFPEHADITINRWVTPNGIRIILTRSKKILRRSLYWGRWSREVWVHGPQDPAGA